MTTHVPGHDTQIGTEPLRSSPVGTLAVRPWRIFVSVMQTIVAGLPLYIIRARVAQWPFFFAFVRPICLASLVRNVEVVATGVRNETAALPRSLMFTLLCALTESTEAKPLPLTACCSKGR